jgi:hypothetical protein
MIITGGEELAKVSKRSGESEEFDRQKLEESVRRAGASPEVAKRVAHQAEPKGDTSSDELRRRVADELRKESTALSGAYLSTKMLRTRTASDLKSGIVRIHEDLLKRQGAKSGEHVMLRHKDHEAKVQIESDSNLHPREIAVSGSDLDRLEAQEGIRLDVKFSK